MRLPAALLVWCLAASVQAQSYPSKSVRMLLAFPPGGPTDINARLFAQKFTEQTGQLFVVENRPGAGGNLAAGEAARAPAATPKDIVARLNAEVNKAVQNPELARWSRVVRDAGAKAD